MQNSPETLNWLAIIVAAISAFVLGGLWYSPLLFQKRWMEESGMTREKARSGNQARLFGLSFILSFIASFFLAVFIGPDSNALSGIHAGLMAGFGWVFTFLGITYLFEGKSLAHFLINAGYCILALMIMGLILGAWH